MYTSDPWSTEPRGEKEITLGASRGDSRCRSRRVRRPEESLRVDRKEPLRADLKEPLRADRKELLRATCKEHPGGAADTVYRHRSPVREFKIPTRMQEDRSPLKRKTVKTADFDLNDLRKGVTNGYSRPRVFK